MAFYRDSTIFLNINLPPHSRKYRYDISILLYYRKFIVSLRLEDCTQKCMAVSRYSIMTFPLRNLRVNLVHLQLYSHNIIVTIITFLSQILRLYPQTYGFVTMLS